MRFLHPVQLDALGRRYKRTIWIIVGGIAALALGQIAWALAIESRQLLKDGTDWVYDVVLYGLAAFIFGRGARIEDVSALLVAAIMALAGFHTLYDLWDKILNPRPIVVEHLGFSAVSAVLVAYAAVALLWRFRRAENPLIQATWLSARNDSISTTLYAALTFLVRAAPVRWPEYVVDLLGAFLAFQAAFSITRASLRAERRAQEAGEGA